MKAGIRFSLHPIVSKFLNYWGVALTHITPNCWNIFFGLLAFPFLAKPNYFTQLAKSEGEGYFALRARAGWRIIEEVSNKIKRWKELFWFVGGDWRSPVDDGSGGPDRIDVPCDYKVNNSKFLFESNSSSTDLTFLLFFAGHEAVKECELSRNFAGHLFQVSCVKLARRVVPRLTENLFQKKIELVLYPNHIAAWIDEDDVDNS